MTDPKTTKPWGVNPDEARARNDALMIANQTRRIADLEARVKELEHGN